MTPAVVVLSGTSSKLAHCNLAFWLISDIQNNCERPLQALPSMIAASSYSSGHPSHEAASMHSFRCKWHSGPGGNTPCMPAETCTTAAARSWTT